MKSQYEQLYGDARTAASGPLSPARALQGNVGKTAPVVAGDLALRLLEKRKLAKGLPWRGDTGSRRLAILRYARPAPLLRRRPECRVSTTAPGCLSAAVLQFA